MSSIMDIGVSQTENCKSKYPIDLCIPGRLLHMHTTTPSTLPLHTHPTVSHAVTSTYQFSPQIGTYSQQYVFCTYGIIFGTYRHQVWSKKHYLVLSITTPLHCDKKEAQLEKPDKVSSIGIQLTISR